MSNQAALPRLPHQTVLPAGMRFGYEADGREYVELDAGGTRWFTNTVSMPQGDTQSLHISADVKSGMMHGNDTFEGVGPAVYAYVRDNANPVELSLIWEKRPEQEGLAKNWIGQALPNYTRVVFIVQIPDDIRPQYIHVHWVARGFSGTARISNVSVRDYPKRAYVKDLPVDTYGLNNFNLGFQQGWNYVDYANGNVIGRNVYTFFLDSFSVNIASGVPIRMTSQAFYGNFNISANGNPIEATYGLALKISRGGDIEWIRISSDVNVPNSASSESIIDNTIQRTTERPVTLIEPVLWILTNQDATALAMQVDGGRVTIEVDDSIFSGVGA